jgi:hypothetical protein
MVLKSFMPFMKHHQSLHAIRLPIPAVLVVEMFNMKIVGARHAAKGISVFFARTVVFEKEIQATLPHVACVVVRRLALDMLLVFLVLENSCASVALCAHLTVGLIEGHILVNEHLYFVFECAAVGIRIVGEEVMRVVRDVELLVLMVGPVPF